MKIIISATVVILLLLTNLNNNFRTNIKDKDIKSDLVIFDGKEGNLCFFTDSSDRPLTIEDEKNSLFKDFELDANTYVGETFKIIIKVKEFKNNVGQADAVIRLQLNSD